MNDRSSYDAPAPDRSRTRVVGLAALGPGVGLGHVVRTLAVLDELRASGVPVTLLVQAAPGLGTTGPWADAYPAVPLVSCAADEVPSRVAAMARQLGGPVVVTTDLPRGAEYDFDSLRQPGITGVVCLNAYDEAGGNAELAFLRGHTWAEATTLPARLRAGAEYEVVSAAVRARRPGSPWHGGRIDRVLITLGAADPDRLTEAVAGQCVDLVPDVLVVVGPLFSDERTGAFEALRRRGVVLHRDPDDLPGLMLTADLVVTLGGQTAYEAMCLGRPVGALRWSGTDRAVDFHVRNRTVADLGSPDQVGDRLQRLIDRPDALGRSAAAAFRLVDGRGAVRIADDILEFFPGLRDRSR